MPNSADHVKRQMRVSSQRINDSFEVIRSLTDDEEGYTINYNLQVFYNGLQFCDLGNENAKMEQVCLVIAEMKKPLTEEQKRRGYKETLRVKTRYKVKENVKQQQLRDDILISSEESPQSTEGSLQLSFRF